MVKSYSANKEAEHNEKITLAYINALWNAQWMGGGSKPPKLDELLNGDKSKKSMTDEEMLIRIKQLNDAFGGEVKEIGD